MGTILERYQGNRGGQSGLPSNNFSDWHIFLHNLHIVVYFMRHKILLIDDDRDDQVNFCRCIYELDPTIECLLAANGSEALLHLKAIKHKPELVFLDLNMPFMDGFEYLSEIRAQRIYDDIPIIIFTTSGSETDREKARVYGAAGFLLKPASIESLKSELRQILRHFFRHEVGQKL